MTVAAAVARALAAQGSRTSFALFFSVLIFSPAPANAELGTTASVFSDLRFRGYSLSEGRPVGIFDFAYDDPSGLYAGGSASAVLKRGGDPAPLGVQLTGGYAKRLKSGTTIDVGVTHSTYSHYSSQTRGTSYTEVYAGVIRGNFSSRLFLSSHYFERGRWTAYGEVNGNISPAPRWSVNGHVGVLVPLRTPSSAESYRTELDWRLGVTRELGRFSLHAAWSAGTPGRDYYRDRPHSRSALVLGATWIL